MKLLYLKINGYKNLLEKTEFDFSASTNYAALIGLNGSGKSNILEAISIIFASLYRGKPVSAWNNDNGFDYTVRYVIEQKEIEIANGIITLIKDKGVVKNKVIRTKKTSYLPSEVISCYSGEEIRMWEDIYSSFYFSYTNKLSKGYVTSKQNLIYLNKYSWNFALLTLLCHESSHQYIRELLQVDDLKNIKIKFSFPSNYRKRKEWFSKGVERGISTNNDITSLIQRIKDEQEQNGNELVYSQISSIDLNVGSDNLKTCRKLFYLLFAAGMPKENKLFTEIGIEFRGIRTKQLSEGEKRIILIKCLVDILSNKNSLILLDEPDSHIHIARKKELKSIIDKKDYYTILTTHSPKLLHEMDEKNIFVISHKEDTGLNVFKGEKQKHLQEVSGGEFSLVDATLALSTTKDILLVEGTNDYNYLLEALERFGPGYPTFNFLIINCGSADNIPAVVEQSILPVVAEKQLAICLFDYDRNGKTGHTKVEEIAKENNKPNIIPLFHPRPDGVTHSDKSGEFYMEDYFKVAGYRDLMKAELDSKARFNDLNVAAKSFIKNNYKRFSNDTYADFKILIEELLKIQKDFRNTPVAATI